MLTSIFVDIRERVISCGFCGAMVETLSFNRHFIVKTNHYSLKYILNQMMMTKFQQIWLFKLVEFDFAIEYKKVEDNVTIDTLSKAEPVESKGMVS